MLHGTGMLLLSLIGGYWLLERAENHKGELRRVGRLLGGLIIILGLFGLIAGAWASCAGMKGGWSCPFGKKAYQHSSAQPETIMVTPSAEAKRKKR